MTLIELCNALFFLGGGIAGGVRGYRMHGAIGAVIGVVVGAVAGLALALAIWVLLALCITVYEWLGEKRPRHTPPS